MVVVGVLVNAASGESLAADGGVGDHALDSQHHGSLRILLHQGAILDFLQTAEPTGAMTVELLIQLLAGQNSLSSVDDDDMVTAVSSTAA